MVENERVDAGNFAEFLETQLEEGLLQEAVFFRAAHRAGCTGGSAAGLNRQLSALRQARESRQASLALGRRMFVLCTALGDWPALERASAQSEFHFVTAFGFISGVLTFDVEAALLAWLQHSVMGTISAAQRLLPLGQTAAGKLLWEIKPKLLEAAGRSRGIEVEDAMNCAMRLDLASMRHPLLRTRLFIS